MAFTVDVQFQHACILVGQNGNRSEKTGQINQVQTRIAAGE
jgi:hypothetical protein